MNITYTQRIIVLVAILLSSTVHGVQQTPPWENPASPAFKLSLDDKRSLSTFLHESIALPERPNAYHQSFLALTHRIKKQISFTGLFKGLSSEQRREALATSLLFIQDQVTQYYNQLNRTNPEALLAPRQEAVESAIRKLLEKLLEQ